MCERSLIKMTSTLSGFTYPPGTPGSDVSNKQGFYHRLSPEQQGTLQFVERYMSDNRIDIVSLALYSLSPKLTLLRYLRANNFNFEKTIDHIHRNIKWRKDININKLIGLQPEEILECDINELIKYYPHWHYGYDKTMRPVLYKNYAKFDVNQIKSATTIDAVEKYHIWEQEICM